MDNFWPISIFLPKNLVWQDVATIFSLLVGYLLFLKIFIEYKSLKLLALAGLLLMVGSNLLQGFSGLHQPLTDAGSYWSDSVKISDLGTFLGFYETLQPTLALHSRSHPPGPIVLLYAMRMVWDQPLFASLLLSAIGLGIVFLLHDFLRQKKVSSENAFFISALFLLLPAVQIYFISSIDAIATPLFWCILGLAESGKHTLVASFTRLICIGVKL